MKYQTGHSTYPLFLIIAVAKTKLEECVMWAVKGVTG